jgi:uncharacterized iron-regulated membrane protein
MSMRTILLKMHLYVALATGIFLLVVSLTGAALVFENEIDRALNPGLSHVEPGGTRLSLQELMQQVGMLEPSRRVTGVRLAAEPDESYQFFVQGGLTLYVNPYSGAVLGRRTAQSRMKGFARFLHVLHTQLVAGETGARIVGTVSVLTALLVVTGLVLWWPRRIMTVNWRASWKRINFDLHHTLGFASSLVLLVISLTGAIIAFPATVDPWIKRLDPSPPPPRPTQSTVLPGKSPITLDEALTIAQAALPGAKLNNINVPQKPTALIIAQMKYPEDRTPAGRSRVFIDQCSGRVLLVENTRSTGPGTRIHNLKRSLHTGDIFGTPTRILYCVACLILASQVITGGIMWWNARKKPAPGDSPGQR